MPTVWRVIVALVSFVIAAALAMWMRSLHYSLLAWLSGAVAAYLALTLIAQACAALVLGRNDSAGEV